MKSDSFPHNLGRGEKFAFFALMGTAAIIVFGTLFGLLVQFLWNATLVDLFGVAQISFWQSIGVLILAKLFFGFGATGGGSKKSKKKKGDASGEAELLKEQDFQDYWEQQGRAAYEEYKASRVDDREDTNDANQ